MQVAPNELLKLLGRKEFSKAARALFGLVGHLCDFRTIPVDIEEVAAGCGLSVSFRHIAADGYLVRSGSSFSIIVNGNRSREKQRFIIAHELAHFLLRQMLNVTEDGQEHSAFREEIERLCDEFACIALVPLRTELTAIGIKQLDFRSLERGARVCCAPIRALFPTIRASGLIDSSETGVLILKPMAKPWGGGRWGLRVWRAYCPRWGFIPESSAERIGLHQISLEWSSLFLQRREVALSESVDVRVRQESGPARVPGSGVRRAGAWRTVRLPQSNVTYRKYTDPNEGIFIVAMFSWPLPSGEKLGN